MTTTKIGTTVIDGDGHVLEDVAGIIEHMPSPYADMARTAAALRAVGTMDIFPPLDHLHTGRAVETPPLRNRRPFVGPTEWLAFLDDVGIERTVLYPTRGLAFGHVVSLDYAAVLARAYNDWVADTYLRADDRFHAMALVPMQDPEEAVKELRRAVTELGMLGAMLPSNGLPQLLGAKCYWPVYEEAERLGCALSVHGGAHDGFGMDHLNMYVPVHALGHPWGLMVNLASVVYNGVFDRFPGLRIAFLEGGVAWLLMCMERFHASHETHFQYIPPGCYGLGEDRRPDEYIVQQVREGRLFVGCETEELTMPFALRKVGNQAFFYSSDFPHEVTNQSCIHDIRELLESEELADDAKSGILARNAERFYRFDGAPRG
ncbi:MAG: amidohydrolase family protein [Actinomycetota bacterium]|jgi:predicted TIM-barrel fold metal-dependent hydrolase|nr:amidohydrolase family protein [Actinomycetota bacterium]